MDATDFQKRVLREFPVLKTDFEEWDGLLHVQVGEFRSFTQRAIEAQSLEIVSRCFAIANAALIEGDPGLRNAVYVSYLEDLDFRNDRNKQAFRLMPAELKQGRNEILDYNFRLLGRKRPTDDR